MSFLDIYKKFLIPAIEADTSTEPTATQSVEEEPEEEIAYTNTDEFNEDLKKVLRPFKTPEELSRWMQKNMRYKEFTRLQGPLDTARRRGGSCHDQVVFELFFLRAMGLMCGSLFLMENFMRKGGMTHSLVYYIEKGKLYWFENAWEDFAGIHVFDNIQELKDYITSLHKGRVFGNYDKYPGLSFKPFIYKIGDNLQQMVNRLYRGN